MKKLLVQIFVLIFGITTLCVGGVLLSLPSIISSIDNSGSSNPGKSPQDDDKIEENVDLPSGSYNLTFNPNSGTLPVGLVSMDVEFPGVNNYGFASTVNGGGITVWESQNFGVNNSYSMCKVTFNQAMSTAYIYVLNFAEANFDYAIFSNKNTTLKSSYEADTANVYKSFKGLSGNYWQELTYSSISSGDYIYVKYRKDNSNSVYNDSVRFYVAGSPEPGVGGFGNDITSWNKYSSASEISATYNSSERTTSVTFITRSNWEIFGSYWGNSHTSGYHVLSVDVTCPTFNYNPDYPNAYGLRIMILKSAPTNSDCSAQAVAWADAPSGFSGTIYIPFCITTSTYYVVINAGFVQDTFSAYTFKFGTWLIRYFSSSSSCTIGDTQSNYGFSYTLPKYGTGSSEIYTSKNKGVAYSYSLARVNFSTNGATTFRFQAYSYGENNYDYLIFGNLNQSLSWSYTADTTYYKSFRGESSSSWQYVTYTIDSAGTYFIDIKYRKDVSGDENYDNAAFLFNQALYNQRVVVYGESGIKYNSAPVPTRTGYIFNGWYSASSGGYKIINTSPFSFVSGVSGYTDSSGNWARSSNTTLYAQWTLDEKTLTINYSSSSKYTTATDIKITQASCTISTSSISSGGSATVKHSTTTSSYTVTIACVNTTSNNYYISVNSTPTTSSSLNSTTYSWTASANATITVYVYERYTLTFHNNGGTGTVPSPVYKIHGTAATLPANNLTRSGFTPNGWNTSGDGTGTNYSTSYGISTGSVTLYANWTPVYATLQVGLRVDSTSGSTSSASTDGGSVNIAWFTTSNNTVTSGHDSRTASALSSVSATILTTYAVYFTPVCNPGYVFMGISTSATALTPATSGNVVTSFTPTSATTYTYYAHFKLASSNELKYDSVEKYYYFEDGEYPQETANISPSSISVQYTIMTDYRSSTGAYLSASVFTYSGQKYARINLGGYKYFKVSPIRWRVSDYGATTPPAAFGYYGGYSSNFSVLSDRVLDAGVFHSRQVMEGATHSSFDMHTAVDNNNSLISLTHAIAVNTTFYEFGGTGSQVVSTSTTKSYSGIKIASLEEVRNSGLSDYKAKMTDYAKAVLGYLNGTSLPDATYSDYWLRNTGNQLGEMNIITYYGDNSTKWMNSACGVRFSYVMDNGSNLL